LTVRADNSFWSSTAIADFIYNDVNLSKNILSDEKYTSNITREEFAELIVSMYALSNKISKEDIPLKDNPFKDTNSIDVQRAYSLGLIKGISQDQYDPLGVVTREAFSTIVIRFLNIKGIQTEIKGNLNDFTDKKDISEWAYTSMLYCVNHGIINGFNKELYPKAATSIEQALTIMDRIALDYKWFIASKDSYYDGFLVPRDAEVTIYTSGRDTSILVDWDKIKDPDKLQKDLYYIFSSKLSDVAQINDLVETIIGAQSYYDTNKNTQDFTKSFETEGPSLRIISLCDSPETWIHID
jgi:hypothetical protein